MSSSSISYIIYIKLSFWFSYFLITAITTQYVFSLLNCEVILCKFCLLYKINQVIRREMQFLYTYICSFKYSKLNICNKVAKSLSNKLFNCILHTFNINFYPMKLLFIKVFLDPVNTPERNEGVISFLQAFSPRPLSST